MHCATMFSAVSTAVGAWQKQAKCFGWLLEGFVEPSDINVSVNGSQLENKDPPYFGGLQNCDKPVVNATER